MQMQVGDAVIPADDLFQLLIADADKGVTHTAFVDRSLTFVRVCLCRSVPVSVPLDAQRHRICDVHYVCVCVHTHMIRTRTHARVPRSLSVVDARGHPVKGKDKQATMLHVGLRPLYSDGPLADKLQQQRLQSIAARDQQPPTPSSQQSASKGASRSLAGPPTPNPAGDHSAASRVSETPQAVPAAGQADAQLVSLEIEPAEVERARANLVRRQAWERQLVKDLSGALDTTEDRFRILPPAHFGDRSDGCSATSGVKEGMVDVMILAGGSSLPTATDLAHRLVLQVCGLHPLVR